jgi:hypothetical protein
MTDASLNFVESLYFCNVYVKSIPGIFNILVNKLSSHMMYAASYMYIQSSECATLKHAAQLSVYVCNLSVVIIITCRFLYYVCRALNMYMIAH